MSTLNKFNSTHAYAPGLFLVAFALAGCRQSPEDTVYEAFKCGKAAAMLERDDDAKRAIASVEPLVAGIVGSGSPARYMMELGQRFQDEVPLYKYSAGEQLRILQEIHESNDCKAMYAPALLNLGNATASGPTGQASTGAAPAVPSGLEPAAPSSEQEEATNALMNVASLLATQGGGDSVAVAQFCEQNARGFASIDELQRCKALAGSPAGAVPVPRTMEEAIQISATLPLNARFDFCTSEQVLALSKRPDDYDRCFPPEARAENVRLNGERDDSNWTPTQTSPLAIKEQIVANAARMNTRERQAYCYIPSVLSKFNNDPSHCLNGEIIPTDQDPGYRDEGN